MTRGPYVAPAPVVDAPEGWRVLPIGDIHGLAHAAVFHRRLHDICQTDRPFSAPVVDAIEQRGWHRAATTDDGTQVWLRERAARCLSARRKCPRAGGRSLA
jgi:hypothetical protein